MHLSDDEDDGKGEAILLLPIVVLDIVGRNKVVGKVHPRHEQVEGRLFGSFGSASLAGLSGLVILDVSEVLLVRPLTADLLQEFLGAGLCGVLIVSYGEDDKEEENERSHCDAC